ncbi:bestrophin family protein [Novosphingobium sp. KACC 22771]|uniref:bestrophin family protein n=1 Tax=Novosphingobium sp. KACC 22771 TaxID=3025670 RepID=UPI002365EBF3|nr:bestrophin family ion channel [Novosphingobium sp. KACC 22771]WDF72182.1 bestrophin family ion channel [Novosphingobium sp. KACC 22771]
MIIHTPHTLRSIARQIKTPLVLLFVWDVIVTITYYVVPFPAPGLPLTLFGSVLALILGFRSTSAYQRWWEGRGLWGLMINASRNLARASRNFMTGAQGQAMARAIVLRQIAYVTALRHQLRRIPMTPDSLPYIPASEAEAALTRTNSANGLLDATGAQVAQARADGIIDTIQQAQIEQVLVDIANAQGGMERLKNTPLPSQFRLFPTYFTHLFCVLLPFGLVEALGPATPLGSTVAGMMFMAVLAIGDDLVDPFANTRHDLPLDTMCRTIEIDLLQGLGESAPAPITADEDGVLW